MLRQPIQTERSNTGDNMLQFLSVYMTSNDYESHLQILPVSVEKESVQASDLELHSWSNNTMMTLGVLLTLVEPMRMMNATALEETTFKIRRNSTRYASLAIQFHKFVQN